MNDHRGFFRNHHVHIHGNAGIAEVESGRMDLVTVANLDRLNFNGSGALLRIGFTEGANCFLTRDAESRLVRRADGDGAVAAANQNAGVAGDRLWININRERIRLAAEIDIHALKQVRSFLNCNYPQNYDHQADDQKNFSRRDPSRAAALPLRKRALVKLCSSPEDEDQRPPMFKNSAELQMAVVVQQNQETENDQ